MDSLWCKCWIWPSFFSRVCKCWISTSRDKGSGGTFMLTQLLESPPCLSLQSDQDKTFTIIIVQGEWKRYDIAFKYNVSITFWCYCYIMIVHCRPRTWMQDHLAANPISRVWERVGLSSRWYCKQSPIASQQVQPSAKIQLASHLAWPTKLLQSLPQNAPTWAAAGLGED